MHATATHIVYNNTAPPEAVVAIFLVILAVVVGFLVISISVAVVVCWILQGCLKRVPPPFRQQEPALAWLLLIPFFNVVWNFFVFLPLARSYQSYFYHRGRAAPGDCGYNISLAYCICSALSWIPYLGLLAWIPALILLIMSLVKARQLSQLIEPWTQQPGEPSNYYVYPPPPYGPPPPPASPPPAN